MAGAFLRLCAMQGVHSVALKAAVGSREGRAESVFLSHLNSTTHLSSALLCGRCCGGCGFFSPRY